MNSKELIFDRMNKRLEKFFKPIALLLNDEYENYWVCGSSCNPDKPNDFDLYSSKGFDFDLIGAFADDMNLKIISETKNALTILINNTPVQFCNYSKDSLKEIVDSFDFAHVQIGVEVHNRWDGGTYISSKINDVYMSEDYIESRIIGNTWFTSSEYPLSSLVRIGKYI